jgi:hypothetical protein
MNEKNGALEQNFLIVCIGNQYLRTEKTCDFINKNSFQALILLINIIS